MIRLIPTSPSRLKTCTRATAFFLGLALAPLNLVLSSCSSNINDEDRVAKKLIQRYGCGTCHSIPGIDWADAHVGPSLDSYQKQAYIAGILPNSQRNLIGFLVEPSAVHEHTAMPDLGLSEFDATIIARYLYSEHAN